MRHRFFPAALALLLVSAFFSAGSATAALAVDNGTLGIRPANESDFFHISLAPGATAETAAIVSNHSNAAVTLLIYPVDATNTSSGGFAFGSQTAARTTVGLWSSITGTRITVKANSEARVALQISVPVRTVPGDYAGGLIIESPPVVGSSSSADKGGAVTRIDVIQRQGVRIYLHVTGTATAKLAPISLSWKSTGSAVDFALPMTNTGTTILHPTATLNVTSSIGAAPLRLSFNTPQSLLPGQSIVISAHLANPPLLEFAHLAATVTSEATTQRPSGTLVLIAWWVLVLILVGLVLLAFAAWRIIRYVRKSREAFRALARMTAAQNNIAP